jgi:DNA-binding CsgD family transcriptional regulator
MPEGRHLSLAEVGLSPDADLVWKLLLRTPDLTLAQACIRTGLSPTAVYERIGELAAAGFLQKAEVPLRWVPVEPSVAVEQHIAVEQRHLADRLAMLSEMRNDLPDLTADFSRGRERLAPRMEMQILEGIDAIRPWLATACANARTEIISMQTAVSTAGLHAARAVDFDTLARGVIGRTLLDTAGLDDPDHVAYYEELSAAGESIRVVRALPARAIIYDREVAILPVDPADLKRAAVVVRAHTIVDCLVALFEQLWSDATPIFSQTECRDRPDGRQARVLELLATGRKDESIARSLGVGVRTVRRDVAALMATLGEKTRPATVAAAIRHGWLAAEPAIASYAGDSERRDESA